MQQVSQFDNIPDPTPAPGSMLERRISHLTGLLPHKEAIDRICEDRNPRAGSIGPINSVAGHDLRLMMAAVNFLSAELMVFQHHAGRFACGGFLTEVHADLLAGNVADATAKLAIIIAAIDKVTGKYHYSSEEPAT